MKAPQSLSPGEAKQIAHLVSTYESHRSQISLFRDQLVTALTNSEPLEPLIHSIRSRIKDPGSLRDKLTRKLNKCDNDQKPFGITPENLLTSITDLAGVRILHLHTTQIKQIDQVLKAILYENRYELLEGPFARTWDDESRRFFLECGIQAQESPTMYTSVHYVIGSASRTKVTAELQVRTLMEEVWGEVDHAVNYPHPVEDLPSREQLKVLARITSSASRLVDSIFATTEHYKKSPSAKTSTDIHHSSQAKSAGAPIAIQISSPHQGATIPPGECHVRGMITGYTDQNLYLFTGKSGRYWPSARISPKDGEWQGTVHVGETSSTAVITVLAVDERLAEYIEFYRQHAPKIDHSGMRLKELSDQLFQIDVVVDLKH